MRPSFSASASARLFGQYVYQELALAMASSTVVTTFGSGAHGVVSVGGRDHRAVDERRSREPRQRIAVTTPPSSQRARTSGSLQRAATTRR